MSCFNDTGEPRTLVGNWQEERVLKDAVGTARLSNVADRALDTTARVLPQAMAGPTPQSTVHDVHNYTKHARSFEGVPVGPRARALQARLRAQCDAEAAAEMEAKRSAVDNRRYLTSTVQANFVAPTPELLSEAATGRRRMKTQDGVALPPGCRDVEWAAAEGLMKPPVRSMQTEPAALDQPVTFWTARLAEGVVPASQIANSRNPFAKSETFTRAMRGDETREQISQHQTQSRQLQQAHGAVAAEPTIHIAMQAGAGSAPAMGSLFARVRAALETKHGLGVYGQLAETLARWDRNGDACIGLDELRRGLQLLSLSLPERELLALFLAMDVDNNGKLTVDELVAALQGSRDEELGLEAGAATALMTGTLAAAAAASGRDSTMHTTRGWADLYAAGVPRPSGAAAAEALGSTGVSMRGGATRGSKRATPAPRATGGTGAALGGSVPPGYAMLHVRHNDGSEEDVVVPDPVGFTAQDIPAMRVALRHANVHHVHHVSLVSRG